MSDATWRAVVLDRDVLHTLVFTSRKVNGGTVWSFRVRPDWWGDYGCDDPTEAILRLALLSRWKLREILPPGAMSSDERAADLRERCAAGCDAMHSALVEEEPDQAVGAARCADAMTTVPLTRPPNARFRRLPAGG